MKQPRLGFIRASEEEAEGAVGVDKDGRSGRVIPLERWFVAVRGVIAGPLRHDQLGARIRSGEVTGASVVWREGFNAWRPLRDVPELVGLARGER